MPGKTLSALVVVHNEENNLPDCLDRLGFADEIVVVLDKCTDRSKEIASRYTSRLVEGEWPIEGDRRNLGIDTCSGDWILEVDADERVTPELAGEIRQVIADAEDGFFLVPFHNYIGERLVRRGWGAYIGTNAKVCLFSRGSKRWGAQTIHPELDLDMSRYHGRLKHAMVHRIDENLTDLLRRFNRYATAMANDDYHANRTGGMLRNLLRIPARFYKCYIYKQGYREGLYGFLIAMLAGLLPITTWLKIRLNKTDH
ncbi:MAG: glycosyltransferase family 2 protein [Gammaproteobacteria bacterium]|nr:glycosyltransferase family 2 protein [Gammaproteobacteria bacterium]